MTIFHWRTIGVQEVCAIEAVRLRKRYGALGCANTLFPLAHHWRMGASIMKLKVERMRPHAGIYNE
jgi:hypothetical protein